MVYVTIYLALQSIALLWFFNWLLDVVKENQKGALEALKLCTQNHLDIQSTRAEVTALFKHVRKLEEKLLGTRLSEQERRALIKCSNGVNDLILRVGNLEQGIGRKP